MIEEFEIDEDLVRSVSNALVAGKNGLGKRNATEMPAKQPHENSNALGIDDKLLQADSSALRVPLKPRMPLRFDSWEQELNFLGIRALLDFGRGYSTIIEECSQKNRDWETVALTGLMSLHISGKKLDKDFLRKVDSFTVNQHFDIPGAVVERQIVPGVFEQCGGPTKPFLDLIVKTMNLAGERLNTIKKPSLGACLVEILNDEFLDAPLFVIKLAELFPQETGFVDDVDGIQLSRKALVLLFEIYGACIDQPERRKYLDRISKGIEYLNAEIDSDIVSALHNAGLFTSKSSSEFSIPLELDIANEEHALIEKNLRKHSLQLLRRLHSHLGNNFASLQEVACALLAKFGPASSSSSQSENGHVDSLRILRVKSTTNY